MEIRTQNEKRTISVLGRKTMHYKTNARQGQRQSRRITFRGVRHGEMQIDHVRWGDVRPKCLTLALFWRKLYAKAHTVFTPHFHRPFRFPLAGILSCLGILVLSSLDSLSLAQQTTIRQLPTHGAVTGTVRSRDGDALAGAYVILRDTPMGASTGNDGMFIVSNIPIGKYFVEVSFIHCQKCSQEIIVQAGKTVTVHFVLDQEPFQIGEMQVEATRPLIPVAPETKTTITSAEIDHLQASSVGDVLDIVPGVQKTANPGLGKNLQIGIRGEQTDALTAFGTKVMIDGVPMSNNANLQFEKWTSSITGTSDVGRGIDLRMIPADNLENIEVIRGIPSVRYGELTSGLINIRTKTGVQPHRLKVKTNPDTKEANLGGGFLWQQSEWSYNVNAARSERDIRKDGDEFTRLTAQLNTSTILLDNQLKLSNKLFGQKIFDEEQPKGDVRKTRNYNRGYGINYALTGEWKMSEVGVFDFNAYVNYRRDNSMKSKLVQGGLRILPTGDTISSYMGQVETRGNAWTVGGRFQWQRTYIPEDYVHQLLAGAEIQYDANTGDGVLIDSILNYYGPESGRRSYRFDRIPGQAILSLYAEDKITGNIGVDFSWVIGARYDMYHPTGFNFSGLLGRADLVQARHGSYLNPRTNFILYLGRGSQFRLSAGTVSKSPPMSTVYAPEDVFRWRNPVDSTIYHFRYDHWATHLKAYKERQFEFGYDQSVSTLFGLSLTGYYKYRYNQPGNVAVPIFYGMTKSNVAYLWYIDSDARTQNTGWNISKGLELSLRSKRIEPLNLDLTVVGSYSYVRDGSNSYSFDDTPDPAKGQYPNHRVRYGPIDTTFGFWYPASGQWRQSILLNYYIRYTVPALGLWATLRIEHLVWKKWRYLNLEPVDHAKLTPEAMLSRNFDESIRSEPPKWLFNLNISKSLFKGAEVSFYVNNFFDSPGLYTTNISYNQTMESTRNPDLFYGLEFSFSIDSMFK